MDRSTFRADRSRRRRGVADCDDVAFCDTERADPTRHAQCSHPVVTPRSSGRILVAAGDASLREVIRAALVEHEVTEVHDAASTRARLQAAWATNASYAALVAVSHMPDGTAFDALRALGPSQRPRTLILTESTSQQVFYEAYRLRCLCVLALPFDPGELRRLVDLIVSAHA